MESCHKRIFFHKPLHACVNRVFSAAIIHLIFNQFFPEKQLVAMDLQHFGRIVIDAEMRIADGAGMAGNQGIHTLQSDI